MIGDAPIKIRQTNQILIQETLTWFYNGKKSSKINSNTANNFSSDVGKQLLISNDRNRVRW
jgi:hypothetical protein